MKPPKLTPTSYVVLGLIAHSGRATSYDLKRIVALSIGNVWSFPHAQLYTEPERLAGLGLLREEREKGGRHRRHFTITAAGKTALREWLCTAPEEPRELRDPGLLRLFFADMMESNELNHLAKTQEDYHRDRLRLLEAEKERLDLERQWAPSRSPLQMGLDYERAATAFWRDVATKALSNGKPKR